MADWEMAWAIWKGILALLGFIVVIGILTVWLGSFVVPFVSGTIAVITVFLYGKVSNDE